jgi:hypothetical protein
MKPLKKLGAGLFITLGTLFVLAAAYVPFNNKIDGQEKLSQAMAALLFGVPITLTGGWMSRKVAQEIEEEKLELLTKTFYKIIKKNDGYITVFQFAMETRLSGKHAEKYLEEKLHEFNANLDVTQTGEIVYLFNINPLEPPKQINPLKQINLAEELEKEKWKVDN